MTLDARRRFILLFALFDAMFCLLLLLSLQNTQLAEDKRQLGNSLEAIEASATEAVERITALESEIEKLQAPEPTSVPTATVTSTPVPPTPTDTLVPPTLTPKP